MKIECDGPAFCETLRLIAERRTEGQEDGSRAELDVGRMAIFEDHAELDDDTLPYGGYQMGDSE